MWYCLPDSSFLLSYKSRDFVPGYSRFALYCLPDSSYCARSPLARSPCSKSITDNADATDLFFHGFFLCNRFYVVNNRISSNQFCLEDNTEQSESNTRLRPGIYKARRDGCLEDSTSQRAKYPCQSDKSVFVSPLSFFSNTDLSYSTDASLGGRYCLPD